MKKLMTSTATKPESGSVRDAQQKVEMYFRKRKPGTRGTANRIAKAVRSLNAYQIGSAAKSLVEMNVLDGKPIGNVMTYWLKSARDAARDERVEGGVDNLTRQGLEQEFGECDVDGGFTDVSLATSVLGAPPPDGGVPQSCIDPLMRTEWEAWQAVVYEWPGDMNDAKFNRLVHALQVWSERLAALRSTQSIRVRETAMRQAIERYLASREAGPSTIKPSPSSHRKSEGHLDFAGRFEFYERNGNVYRAPVAYDIVGGIRVPSQVECDQASWSKNRELVLAAAKSL